MTHQHTDTPQATAISRSIPLPSQQPALSTLNRYIPLPSIPPRRDSPLTNRHWHLNPSTQPQESAQTKLTPRRCRTTRTYSLPRSSRSFHRAGPGDSGAGRATGTPGPRPPQLRNQKHPEQEQPRNSSRIPNLDQRPALVNTAN